MTKDYPRDLVGYGAKPPNPQWPNQARIALQFVVNYEEGGENCVLHGDDASEKFLSEIVGAEAYPDRHLSMESIYEYGSRAGFWRLHRLFTQQNIPITVFGVASALEKNPDAVDAMLDADWEIASHGLRWIHYQNFSEQEERRHIAKAIEIHERVTGSKPKGWYTGRTSPHTLKLIAERNDLLYCADSYADDLPYWDNNYSKPLLMVPYTLDSNDMRFATPQGFNTGEQFFQYLKDSFDELYQEGDETPKMLSIGLHCRLIGRPGRLAGLRRFIEYTRQFDKVWYATRAEIAEHFLLHDDADKAEAKTQQYNVADISACNTNIQKGLLKSYSVSVKDLFDVQGFKTGAGLPAWLSHAKPAENHASAVSKLMGNGAHLTHKTQLDELAYSLAGINSHYGVSRNPLNFGHLSGGSSSGAAVSVALGESDIGLATDTGGSIRVPASYCGLYGLRPTYGDISVEGLVPLAPRFDTVGVLTRDIDSLELAVRALLMDKTQHSKTRLINQLVWCDELWCGVDDRLRALAWSYYQNFTGVKREIGPPPLDANQRRRCFSALQAESIWARHGTWLDENLAQFGSDTKKRLGWGKAILSDESEMRHANSDFDEWQHSKGDWLEPQSTLIMPTAPSIAPKVDSLDSAELQRNTLLGLTSIAGLSGWPQLQVPLKQIDDLPLGISLLGRKGSDLSLVHFARGLFQLNCEQKELV